LTTPLDVIMIFLGINLIRFQNWARKTTLLICGLLLLYTGLNWFLPDSMVLLDLNNSEYPVNTWFDFFMYLVLDLVPIIVLTRPNIKQQFNK